MKTVDRKFNKFMKRGRSFSVCVFSRLFFASIFRLLLLLFLYVFCIIWRKHPFCLAILNVLHFVIKFDDKKRESQVKCKIVWNIWKFLMNIIFIYFGEFNKVYFYAKDAFVMHNKRIFGKKLRYLKGNGVTHFVRLILHLSYFWLLFFYFSIYT